MLYAYLKNNVEKEIQVKIVKKSIIYLTSKNQQLLQKDIAFIKYSCPVCNKVETKTVPLINSKLRKTGIVACNHCSLNKLYLDDETRKQYFKEKKGKELITKTKNGTSPKQLAEKGLNPFRNMDQSKDSKIRKKMNQTKTKNNTFGHNGSSTRDKMNLTMSKHKTSQKELLRGWAKWSKEEKITFNQINQPGFLSWTREQRLEHNRKIVQNADWDKIVEKRLKTQIKNGTIINPEKLTEWQRYHREVWKVTNKQPISTLKNCEKRGRIDLKENAYHLDHMYSIYQGFKDNVSPEIIGNIANLEMISHYENCSKNKKCSLTLKVLENRIAKQQVSSL